MDRKMSTKVWIAAASLLLALSAAAIAEPRTTEAAQVSWEELVRVEAAVGTVVECGGGTCSDCYVVGESCNADGWKGKCVATDIKCPKDSSTVRCFCKPPLGDVPIDPGISVNACAR